MNVSWTAEEFNFVKENRGKMTLREIGEMINKSEKAVKRKLEREGYRTGKRKEWTEEEQKLLVENLDKSVSELMPLFPDRKRPTILQKYNALKRSLNDN